MVFFGSAAEPGQCQELEDWCGRVFDGLFFDGLPFEDKLSYYLRNGHESVLATAGQFAMDSTLTTSLTV